LNKSSLSKNNLNFKIEQRRKEVASLVAQSLTESQIAAQLGVSQPTIHRDIEALKEASQQFVHDLARSDLAHYFKQSIDELEEVKKESWIIYRSTNSDVQVKDRLTALRVISDCAVKKFEILQNGPSVMAMQSMHQRLEAVERASRNETAEVS
jgi:IS30 family transposase